MTSDTETEVNEYSVREDDLDLSRRLLEAREAQLRASSEAAALGERLSALEAAQPLVVAAVRTATRLCETVRRDSGNAFRSWFVRSEARTLAARESGLSDEVRMLAYVAGDASGLVSMSERAATDMVAALTRTVSFDVATLQPIDLVEAWATAERSDRRLDRDKEQGDLEEASAESVRMIEGLSTLPSPHAAMEVIRRIASEPRVRNPGRLAGLLAPLVLRTGFETPNALFGLARSLPRADALREAVEDEDAFVATMFSAVADSARRSLSAVGEFAALRESLRVKAGHERSHGRLGDAIDAFLSVPVQNVNALAGTIKSTQKGAQLLVDRLVGVGVVRQLDSRHKGRIYICDRALLAS